MKDHETAPALEATVALPSGKCSVLDPPVSANPPGVLPMREIEPGASFMPLKPL